MKATPSRASIVLLAWMVLAQWRAQPGRMLASVLAIAVGVCVGLAIHLVNRSALDEFAGALAVVNGEAQARLVAIGTSIDELAYDRASQDPAIEAASPVIETRVLVRRIGTDEAPGRSTTLPLIAIDPMRAASVTPALVPAVDRSSQAPDRFGGLFAPDAVFLSAAALATLDVRLGDAVRIVAGGSRMRARVAGRLDGAAAGQALIVMDISTAQWRLGWLGRLSRIDLRLREGADRGALARRVAADPARWRLVTPDASASRMSSLSRAYRVNLNVLALVALFTGAFIVQSTLSLAVIRQQAQLALLGVLGASRRLLLAVVLLQGVWLGTIGAVFGIALGLGLAALLLSAMGGDLGGGYFDQSVPTLSIDLPATLAIGVLGVAAGTIGALVPALGIARQASAAALRAGAGEAATSMRPAIAIGIAAAIAASALMQLPPIAGLPLGAYAAIACVLIGGIALTGPLLRACTAMLARFGDSLWRVPPMWLGALRPMRAPRAAAAAGAGVVASFALASAMSIMVHSFRESVEQWLDQVLPADVYGRAAPGGATGVLDADLRAALARLPGIARIEFSRSATVSLDPAMPEVVVFARPLDAAAPGAKLPLTDAPLVSAPPGCIPVWVSEAMVDLYRLAPGARLRLPLGPPEQCFMSAGVWRDYARQHGAIVMPLSAYRRLSGDEHVNEVAIWLEPTALGPDRRAAAATLVAGARALLSHPDAMRFRDASELRELSLRIFDRSFAVTYVLVAIAIAVGLFGVTTTYAGEAMSRAREFGMLRHLGVTRLQIAGVFATESLLGIGLSTAWGLVLGSLVALVLVRFVNPQSFHWTMDFSWPVGLLAAASLAVLAAGVSAAVLAARQAAGRAPVLAVRQDW